MAQSNAGEGLDKWLASLGKAKEKPKARGEWSPQDQRDLDTKNAINDFIRNLTRSGSVDANSDSAGRSVEEKNAARTRSTAPGVKGPLARGGQLGEGTGPEGGLGDAVQKLLHVLHEHVGSGSVVGHPVRTAKNEPYPEKPKTEWLRQYEQDRTAKILKPLGKPGKPVNRGLM